MTAATPPAATPVSTTRPGMPVDWPLPYWQKAAVTGPAGISPARLRPTAGS
jgi:hypothetical protein